LLRFRVHQLQLRGRNYLLLPKLNPAQMQILANRLTNQGFNVQGTETISAKSKAGTIHVDPVGLCWSSLEFDDLILPVVPEILGCKKEMVPLKTLENSYFKLARSYEKTMVRMSTRIESSSNWDTLRSSGECGLTPDEWLVSSFFMEVVGNCATMTDFPTDGSDPVICGRRRYYETLLDGKEASSMLRVVGERQQRNSYLPRDATLRLAGVVFPSHKDISELLNGLGEWCFLATT
jgi:hypothetical protein